MGESDELYSWKPWESTKKNKRLQSPWSQDNGMASGFEKAEYYETLWYYETLLS